MKPKHNRIFCIGCHHNKMLFATQAKADNFIKFNSEAIAAHSSKVPSRSYYCSFCCGWHVTSIDDDNIAKQRDERDAKVWEAIKTKLKKQEDVSQTQIATFSDTLAHFRLLFEKYYQISFDFDGPHTLTVDNVRNDLAPVIRQMLKEVRPLRDRCFRHFKGNEYRLYHKAKDSETQSRMVVYQALYGKKGFWVRPEKMFFERIIRDGKEFPRFAEIYKADS